MKHLATLIAWTSVAPIFGQALEPARIELHAIHTVTLTDRQFLTGVREGTPTTIAAELRLPLAGNARMPAIIMLHGSTGASGTHDRWAREFNELGIATLLIDSFTGRGITSTATDQSQLGETVMVNDAYRGYDLLAKHPRIDATRIVLFGGSRGGVGALHASITRLQRMHATPGTDFVAYISLYPPCSRTYIDSTKVAARPIRMFHGTADLIAPIGQCRAYSQRLKDAGADIVLTEYAGAHHGFDSRVVSSSSPAPADTGMPPCDLYEEPAGRILNRATGAPFTRDDDCTKRPRYTTYDADAQAKVSADVKQVLEAVLGVAPTGR
jgi:dienelactone hydrolase